MIAPIFLGMIALEILFCIFLSLIICHYSSNDLATKIGNYFKEKQIKRVEQYATWVFPVLAVIVFIFSFLPNIVDFRETIIGKNAINLENARNVIYFNVLVVVIPFILSLYIVLARKILLSPFQKKYEDIDERYSMEHGGYHTARIYILEALDRLKQAASHINNKIIHGSIEDDGWKNTDGPRRKKLGEFLDIDNKIHEKYLDLDTFRDYSNPIFKDMFLDIYKKTDTEFLSKITRLMENEVVDTPEFMADLILNKVGSLNGIQGQYATSLVDFSKFLDFYRFIDVSQIAQKHPAERIFIIDIHEMWNEFKTDVIQIRAEKYEGLPSGLGTIFSSNIHIPKLFGVLEWHFKNYWQMFFTSRGQAEGLFKKHKQTNSIPGMLDFFIANIAKKDPYNIVFSVDTNNPPKRPYYNLSLNYYRTMCVRQNDNSTFDFFNVLKSNGHAVEDVIFEKVKAETDYCKTFKLRGINEDISLEDIMNKFKDRTTNSGWVNEK